MSEPGWLERNAWEAAAGLAAFGAAGLGAWTKGWLGGLAPAPGQVERFARHKWREARRRSAPFAREGRFLAVLCCLEGDDAQETTLKALARAFDAHEAIDVALDWRRLSLNGGARGPAREAAQRRALAIGREYRADVVVWGEVAKAGEGLRLHVQGGEQIETRDLIFDKGFLKEEVKKDFAGALGAIVAAVALASVRPATEEQGRYLVHKLRPVAARLTRLVASGLEAIPPAMRGGVHFAHGQALRVVGDQGGETKTLRGAVAAFEAALGEYTRERAPLAWAATQNNLGNALRALGERGDDGALRRAVAAYEAALQVFQDYDAPAYVSMAEGNRDRARALLDARRPGLSDAPAVAPRGQGSAAEGEEALPLSPSP